MVKARKDYASKYILPLFIVAASLVFAINFAIILTPAVVTKFGFEPLILLLLASAGIVSAMLAILFYLMLKGEIRV